MDKLKVLIKSELLYDSILHGAENYAEYCRRNKTEPQFIKQFSTWVNQECWNDEYNQPAQEYKTTLNEWEIYND